MNRIILLLKPPPLFNIDSESQKDNKELTLLNLNTVDTINIENNRLAVIVGDIRSISNDSICILELNVRKSSHPELLSINKSIVCLIDYKNKIIYDQSDKSIGPYKIRHSDSLFKSNRLKKIESTDTAHSLVYNWNSNFIEVNSADSIPSNVRASFLDINNSFGISTQRTNNQLIELKKFNITSLPTEEKVEEIKSKCLKRKQVKTLLYL